MATKELKLALVPESQADSRAAPIYKKHPDVQTTILAGFGEVQLHLFAQASTEEEAQAKVDRLASELEDEFQEAVFATSGESLEKIAGYYLQMRDATVAVAESCTGGLLAQRITSVSGSSRYFVGGADRLLERSEIAVLQRSAADDRRAWGGEQAGGRRHGRGNPQTLPFDPGGGHHRSRRADRRHGRETCGLGLHRALRQQRNQGGGAALPGDRERIRHWATQQALDMIRRRLI